MLHDEGSQQGESVQGDEYAGGHGGQEVSQLATSGGDDGEGGAGDRGDEGPDCDAHELATVGVRCPTTTLSCVQGEGHASGHRCGQKVGDDRTDARPQGEDEAEPGDHGGNRHARPCVGVHPQPAELALSGGVRSSCQPATASCQLQAETPQTSQVGERRGGNVDARIGVVHPVDGNLVDAEPIVLGDHEQFRVEEPTGVLDERHEPGDELSAQGLEAALSVGEAAAHRQADEAVVGAGDELPARPTHDAGSGTEPRSDGEVAVTGEKRCDER